jgi:hypothetical protein
MARFNRTRLIEQLREMAAQQQQYKGFDHNKGTAQLYPRGQSSAELDALIDRCVAYGRWRATQDFAEDLASRQAGT